MASPHRQILKDATASATTVSTPTTLLAFTTFGDQFNRLLFAVRNLDATKSVILTVKTSEDGVVADGEEFEAPLAIAPGTWGHVWVHQGSLHTYWSLVAKSSDASSVQVKWMIKGAVA